VWRGCRLRVSSSSGMGMQTRRTAAASPPVGCGGCDGQSWPAQGFDRQGLFSPRQAPSWPRGLKERKGYPKVRFTGIVAGRGNRRVTLGVEISVLACANARSAADDGPVQPLLHLLPG
jgi:hypothetical protein